MRTKRKGEWLEIVASSNWHDLTIEQLLKEKLQLPKPLLHQFRMNKSVTINGDIVPWSTKISNNDKIQLHLFQKEEYGVAPTYMDLQILYEDDHVLVVNKPANVSTHPVEKDDTNSLANGVAFYLLSNGIETKIRHVHRLDIDTTGTILFAKHRLAASILDRMLQEQKINRAYVALVEGKFNKKKGVIKEPIGKDRHIAGKRRVSQTGQPAITKFEVLKYDERKNRSVVKFQLYTGRTHQIRVHSSFLGHPLVGDTLYGARLTDVHRYALHAYLLEFPHPITEQKIKCTAPFIDDPPIFPSDLQL